MQLITLLALAKKRKAALGAVKLRKFRMSLHSRLKAVKVRPTKLLLLQQLFRQLDRNKSVRRSISCCRKKKKRRWWVRPIFKNHTSDGAWFKLIPKMRKDDTDKFYNFFRMNAESFDFLLEMVQPHIAKKNTLFREAVCAGERLAITLRYFATGDSFLSLSYLFLVSDQLISEIVFETSIVIWEALEPIVFEPLNEETWLRVASEYEVMWKMPHCIGGIDGKHCFLKAPAHSGSRFFSFKHRFSLILMAVADAKRKFIMVDVGASGRRGDGNVFHASVFGEMLQRGSLNIPPPCPFAGVEGNLPFFLIGDGAFERSENLLNPFTRKGGILNAPERVFNSRFSGARHCIEDAFGILYERFGVFSKAMEVSKTCARKVILACCALHNMHLMDMDSISPKWNRPEPHLYLHTEDEKGNLIPGRYKYENPEEETKALLRLRSNVFKISVTGIQKEDNLVGEDIREVLLDYFIDTLNPRRCAKAHVV